MKKIYLFSLLITVSLGFFSCASIPKNYPVPSTDGSALAFTLKFSANTIMGTGFSSPISAIWAVRLKDNTMQSDEIFISDTVSDETAYFFNMKPGRYALLGLTYKKTFKGNSGNVGRSAYVPDMEMISLFLLPEIDMKKTVIEAKPGSICYGGIISINACGNLIDEIQEYYEERLLNKDDEKTVYPVLSSVEKAKGCEIRGIIKSKAAKKEIIEKLRHDFKGTPWETYINQDSAAEQSVPPVQ